MDANHGSTPPVPGSAGCGPWVKSAVPTGMSAQWWKKPLGPVSDPAGPAGDRYGEPHARLRRGIAVETILPAGGR